MAECDILLHADVIVTQNRDRDILENASLAIGSGRIMDIGETLAMTASWHPRREVDMRGCMVLPGLVNAHAHASMIFLRGFSDDLPLMQWLEQSVFPVESRLSPDICRLGALLGYAEMLSTGVTACIDMYIFEEAVFEAASMAGLRCLGGEAVFEFPSAACSDYREALARTRELAKKYAYNDRLSLAVNPHSVYTTTPGILRACRDLALDLDIPLHIHLGETENETSLCLRKYGMRPVAWAQCQGLFETRLIAAHCVDMNEEEIVLLAEKGASVAHCPSSNMKLASGLAPVPQMLDNGVNVAFGTDGPASNNQLNIFAEMRMAALVHKLAAKNPTVMAAPEILDMATLGGARAFGREDIGSLEVGKAADCIALDISSPNFQPFANPVSQAVYSATGHECRMTMVQGDILYQDGKYAGFDIEAARAEAKNLAKFAAGKK